MTLTSTPTSLIGHHVRISYSDPFFFPDQVGGVLLPGEHVAPRSAWRGPAGSEYLVVPFERVLGVVEVTH